METRKAIIVALIVCAIGISLAAPAIAGALTSSPTKSLDESVIRAGSPFAFELTKSAEDTLYYNRLLMFIEDENGIVEVPVYGYYYQSRDMTQVVYTIWVPEEVRTGNYKLTVSVQERTWIVLEYGDNLYQEGRYGPWTQAYRLDYNVVILESDTNLIYCNEASVFDERFSGTDGIEEYLDLGQRKTLMATLSDEVEQRGL